MVKHPSNWDRLRRGRGQPLEPRRHDDHPHGHGPHRSPEEIAGRGRHPRWTLRGTTVPRSHRPSARSRTDPAAPSGTDWRWAVGSPSGAKQHDHAWIRFAPKPSHDPSSARSRSSRPVDTLGPSWASSPTSTTRRRRTWCSRVTACSSGFRCVTSRAHRAFRGVVRSSPTPCRRCRGFGARQPFRPLRA